jgi:TolB-like protein/Flp pilus assembly protein TadD
LIALVSEAPARVDEIRPDLSKEVADLIDRCLKKDISDRVQHANEVAAVLRNLSNERLTSEPAVSQPTVSLNISSKEESIGVLPFRSLSRDTDDEFFAEGISEEIINALSRLPDVKVAARTSAFSFKGKNEDLRVIGEKLGVRRILEGSVRRSGDRVRITVQLVDATTGYHLWSERYDRESGDVFDIQDEIARKIASHLTATISSTLDAAIVHHGTKDVDAFRIYAQGRSLLEHRTADEMWRAVSCFERAIERDPGYAHAWTGLADALVLLEDYRFAAFESLTSRAKEASVRALELDPELAEAHASRALLHGLRREGEAALEELEKAIFYKPNYADAHNWLGWLLVILGKASRGVKYSKRAVELNPLSPEALSNLSLAYLAIGDYQQALKEAQRSKEIQPYFETAMFFEGLSHFFLKDFDRAKSILQKISVPWAGQGPMGVVGLAHVASGEITTAKKLLSELKESDAACAALIHLAMGEHEAGLALFETVDRWDYWPTLSILTLFPDVFEALQDDPQYKNLKRKVLAFWGMKPDPSAE